jgi:hypothetical protein
LCRTRIAAAFLVSRVVAVLVSGSSQGFLPKGRWFAPRPWDPYDPRFSFLRWDARWYQSIADNGYSFDPEKESNVAFFPAYPLFVRALAHVTGDTVLSALLISNLFALLACFVLHALVKRETSNEGAADDAVLFFVLSPVGFFFSIFYTEGLFVFLAITCVACARSGYFGFAAAACAVASATKALGVLLIIPLGMQLHHTVRQAKAPPAAYLWLLVAPTGLAMYMGYLYQEFGSVLTFMEAERAWGRELATPFLGLWRMRRHSALDRAVVVLTILAGVALVRELFRRDLWRGYGVYSAVFFLAISSTGILTSLPRHTSAIFPLYLALGLVSSAHRHTRVPLLVTSGAMFLVSSVAFTNGYRIM